MTSEPAGLISFVGAGPGAPDLITLRGADRLRRADVVVWASSLVPEAVLDHARPGAAVHDSAGMTLEDVLAVYDQHPDARIVRLHSGDPAIYGALQEQLDWCTARRRPFEIVPGVSSLTAAAAAVRRELTAPAVSQSVVLTRLAARTGASVPEHERLAELAASGCTLAVFLSAAQPEALQAELLRPPSAFQPTTPAAIVVRASWPDEQIVPTTVGRLAADLRATGATTTVLVLVGDVLEAAPARSHLYAPSFAHRFRRRSRAGSTVGRPTGPLARRRAGRG
jgi:precorrin-4/cobalt-precorrin-4 C11-methyltransferase